jgi:hypothetical protein
LLIRYEKKSIFYLHNKIYSFFKYLKEFSFWNRIRIRYFIYGIRKAFPNTRLYEQMKVKVEMSRFKQIVQNSSVPKIRIQKQWKRRLIRKHLRLKISLDFFSEDECMKAYDCFQPFHSTFCSTLGFIHTILARFFLYRIYF